MANNQSLLLPQRTCNHPGVDNVWDDIPNIFAGAKSELRGTFDVLLDCTGTAKPTKYYPPITFGDDPRAAKFQSLIPLGAPDPLMIAIDWPDGGMPPVLPGFWAELLRTLGDDTMAVCCMGGHGRTGTALAALRMAWCAQQDGNDETLATIVEDIRFFHCDHAVETGAQCHYLQDLAAYFKIDATEPIEGSYSIAEKERQAKLKLAPTSLGTTITRPADIAARELLASQPGIARTDVTDYVDLLRQQAQQRGSNDPLARATVSFKKGDKISNKAGAKGARSKK